jgi:outer membrane protein OmpA-like peptidoglycan-associated protein
MTTKTERMLKVVTTLLLGSGVIFAQGQGGSVPIYRISVVARTTKAINYNHRSGSTRIGFRGTALMPEAVGEAKVESKQGVIKIDAEMQKLVPATTFGPEYLTYVLWAITPEGRATNVGEILLNGGTKSHIDATTELQSFGLIVTAEPYFAVTQPSDVVVMENFVRKDTTGTIEQVDAKFELLKRGQYTLNVRPSDIHPMQLDRKVPLELYEARNAVQIARWTGAERYAPDTLLKATQGLQNAEGYLQGKAGSKPIGTVAREAVQMAEDARIITVRKIEEEFRMNEKMASAEREAKSEAQRAAAQRETERTRETAEAARVSAEQEAARIKRESDAQRAAARSDIDAATRAKAEAEAASLAAQSATREANDLRIKAEGEKAALRAQLLKQFSLVLETRDTARGLIVNMSDVLFDTGKFTLRPAAREKMAKVAGIILGHPGLRLEVEGYTDNVGGDDYNQTLSEKRAGAVRDYLTQQGISGNAVAVKGFGKSEPVASNDTAAGRQQNRRVELVVSGEIIGMQIGASQ